MDAEEGIMAGTISKVASWVTVYVCVCVCVCVSVSVHAYLCADSHKCGICMH